MDPLIPPAPAPLLTAEECRVLGCLIEKEFTTPDYYPMSANSLMAACNQTTNRDPVVSFDESLVEAALTALRQKRLAAMIHLAGSRVPKFKHLSDEYFPGLGRPEFALLALLLLRGPQTIAELRARSERLHRFADNEAVEKALARLAEYGDGPLVAWLPAGGGRRTATCAHTLAGQPHPAPARVATAPPGTIIPPPPDRLLALETELAALRDEAGKLRTRLESLERSLGISPPEG